jgi:hypothetical protein
MRPVLLPALTLGLAQILCGDSVVASPSLPTIYMCASALLLAMETPAV